VAHPRVPAAHRDKIRQAFISLSRTTKGKKLLTRIPIRALTTASIEDYLPMRNWGLEEFWDHSSNVE
jgi:phosphonate transport system substrate-binding protein